MHQKKDKRTHVVKVTLTIDEIEHLDKIRGKTPRATFLRKAVFAENSIIKSIPQKDIFILLTRMNTNKEQIKSVVSRAILHEEKVIINELEILGRCIDKLWWINKEVQTNNRDFRIIFSNILRKNGEKLNKFSKDFNSNYRVNYNHFMQEITIIIQDLNKFIEQNKKLIPC